MDVIFLVGGLYCIVHGFGAYNQHADPSWRSAGGDYAVEDGCTGCLWWVIAALMLAVAIA